VFYGRASTSARNRRAPSTLAWPPPWRRWPACTATRVSTPWPSRSTAARSRSGRRPGDPSIPIWSPHSTAWPGSATGSEIRRAEPLYWRSLVIWEKAVGADHPHRRHRARQFGRRLRRRGGLRQGRAALPRALAIPREGRLASFDKLASLYIGEQRFLEAEQLYKRALAVAERMNEPVELGMVLEKYGELLAPSRSLRRGAEVQARVKQSTTSCDGAVRGTERREALSGLLRRWAPKQAHPADRWRRPR